MDAKLVCFSCVVPCERGIQYAAAYRLKRTISGILGRPVESGDDDQK